MRMTTAHWITCNERASLNDEGRDLIRETIALERQWREANETRQAWEPWERLAAWGCEDLRWC